MDLTDVIHISSPELQKFEPDLFIAASGYESRSISIPSQLGEIPGNKIVIAFSEHKKEISRPKNDDFYESDNYTKIVCSGLESPDFQSIFEEFSNNDHLKVMIDISVMTRLWYHAFLHFLYGCDSNKTMIVRFAYCAAVFNAPMILKKKVSLKKFILDDPGLNFGKSDKKTALIMGLGVEKDVAQQIHKLLNPDLTYLLFADPSIQKNYVETVFINNHNIIHDTDIKNLKGYPLQNTQEIYSLLIDLVLPLRKDYQIILVPNGPKIFSVIAMILHFSYPDIDLYHPKYNVKKISDRESSGQYTAFDLLFEAE